jgi:hypothetical protein
MAGDTSEALFPFNFKSDVKPNSFAMSILEIRVFDKRRPFVRHPNRSIETSIWSRAGRVR